MFPILALFLLVSATGNVECLRGPLLKSPYFASLINTLKLPVTYRRGSLGVNILGFHASAGLFGGLLAEDSGIGGPHGEASTPWGQSGGAGIGLRHEKGHVYGYLYAYSQLGEGKLGFALQGTIDKGRPRFKFDRIKD